MTEIVGVRFTPGGKVYHFSPEGRKLTKDTKVIVETVRGVECGEIALENTEVSSDSIATALKPIKRVATKEDLDRIEKNKEKEKQAFDYCEERIAARGLNMKLINVECMFDNRKLLFYFSADGRIDFRELVKDLASVFKTRIELRQIGVRDEAKLLGGIGVCGTEYCCKG
jgi:cell fate regulator YaaT (PSP1 superfamily)